MKIALLFVCVNQPYWPYLKDVIADCDNNFLTNRQLGHTVDYFAWTDLPEGTTYGATVFPMDEMQWPMPTLMRYHFFLQQEEILKDYDYIFYLDADMRVVAPIGNEILGEGLTVAEHPMYAFKRGLYAPLEPNPESTAFVKRFGMITTDETDGKPWFKPVYAAGGFQGGKAKEFLKAMHAIKKTIDDDFKKNYIAIWNDETHWNKYLSDYKGKVTVLSPSYVYPDSLIKEYYEPLWGKSYVPKIITLTKPFTVSKEGGEAVRKMLGLSAPVVPNEFRCPTCNDTLKHETQQILSVKECNGSGKPHQVELKNI
jgi:hypothetical protein